MIILGIETSCDETSAAVVEDGQKVLSNVVSSSIELHKKYKGIVPEIASREQVCSIIPVMEEALVKASEVGDWKWEDGKRIEKLDKKESHLLLQNLASHFPPLISKIDAIAVTVGPGLVGSLLVGVETAKALAFAWNKPLVAVSHLWGHVYANWLSPETRNQRPETRTPQFPLVALIVSGGHTELILMTNHKKYKLLGGTLDDAAGEAFDKVARFLGLGYPGGPVIERAAQQLTSDSGQLTFKLPRPMIGSKNYNFSFSGLKTAVVNTVKKANSRKQLAVSDIAASFQQAIIGVLVAKTVRAAQEFEAKEIVVGGGVAANSALRLQLTADGNKLGIKVRFAPLEYCGDNGAMIASAAYFNFKPKPISQVQANPSLHF